MTKQERIIAAVIISLTSVMIISSIITVCIVSICVNQNNKPELLISDIKIVNDIDSIHEINSELNSFLPLEILINNGNDLSEYQSPRITWKIVGDNLDCSITTTGLFTSGNVIETVKVTVVVECSNKMSEYVYIHVNPKEGVELQSVSVESESEQTYIEGQKFNPLSVKLWANFGTNVVRVASFEYLQDCLTVFDTDIILSYTFKNVKKSVVLPIVVYEKTLQEIKIKKLPNKTTYYEGELFDKTGMVLVANYEYIKDVEISDYQIANILNVLTPDINNIEISYFENGINKKISLSITVTPKKLQSITLDLTNVNVEYTQGQNLDVTNLVVIANYEAMQRVVVDYEVNKSDCLKVSDTDVLVSYMENGITVSQSFPIVVIAPYSKTREVVLENPYDALLTWVYTYQDGSGVFHSDFTEVNVSEYENIDLGYNATTGRYCVPVGAEVIITAINPAVTDIMLDGKTLNLTYPDIFGKFILKDSTEPLHVEFKKMIENKITVRLENGINGMSKAFIYPNSWNTTMRANDLAQISQIYTDDTDYYFVYEVLGNEYRFNDLINLIISSDTLISVKRKEYVEPNHMVQVDIEYYNGIVLSVLVDKLADNSLTRLPRIERTGYSFDGYFCQYDNELFDTDTFTSWLSEITGNGNRIYAKYTLNTTSQTGQIVNTWYSEDVETVIGTATFTFTFSASGTYSYLVKVNGEKNFWFNGVYEYDENTITLLSIETDMPYLPITINDIHLSLTSENLEATMFVVDGLSVYDDEIQLKY